MNICHWTWTNGSGMHRVAESLAKAEGSVLAHPHEKDTWPDISTIDIHVIHTHLPSELLPAIAAKGAKIIWVGHGTPDHMYHETVLESEKHAYGQSDFVMLMQHWIKVADARVTFWPRHKWLYDQMLSKGARPTDCLPMGVDTEFWKAQDTRGKFAGEPSILHCDNPHAFKGSYDLLCTVPTIAKAHPKMMAHMAYQVTDLHRALFPFANQLGAGYYTHIHAAPFAQDELRNALNSVDFFASLVRYGDHNHLSMQAAACGAKVISYPGNLYADYWVECGDQRKLAEQISNILLLKELAEGYNERKLAPPTLAEMAAAFRKVYEEIA